MGLSVEIFVGLMLAWCCYWLGYGCVGWFAGAGCLHGVFCVVASVCVGLRVLFGVIMDSGRVLRFGVFRIF